MSKKSFILHIDSLNILDDMTNEQAGIFIKSLLHFQKTDTLPELEFGLKMAIKPFINQFKRDNEKWQKRVEVNIANGSKGGRPKAKNPKKPKETQNNPMGFSETQQNPTEPKKPVNVNVNVNDNVNVNENPNTVSSINADEKISPLTKMRRDSLQVWKKIASENRMKFKNDEWEEIYGYIIAKPSLQPHEITTTLRSIHQWANDGLDIKDALRAGQRFKSLARPKAVILYDKNNKRIYGQGIIELRNRIIEAEELAEKEAKK